MMFSCLLQQLRDRPQACEPVLRLLTVSDPDCRQTTARRGGLVKVMLLHLLEQLWDRLVSRFSGLLPFIQSYFRQTERGWFIRTFTNLIEQLRDRLCEHSQWLDLLVAVRGVSFLLTECFDALYRVPGEAGHEEGQEGRACMHALKSLRKSETNHMKCHITAFQLVSNLISAALEWKVMEQCTMPGIPNLMLKRHAELQIESATLVQMHLEFLFRTVCSATCLVSQPVIKRVTVSGVSAPPSQRSVRSRCWLCTELHLQELPWLRQRVT